ncbi:two-component sensor histidine kinase [Mycobacteroides franklinii]|uniref:Sensor histidine kinase MtrB n=1 Tax=Mycobacteroides franklinii TaxID=948102 RepID=A0A1S1L8W8_9MYCO|nr:MtrAB system histidine kinase MtrB [Mycobacteroides franklinii]NGX09241.1 histidine kinase [Mycobacteroides franklinii]OHU22266.1 two-component sensor histidine kinase [Mycobacteroides franklinii]
MIFSSKRRIQRRSAPLIRGLKALSRAVGFTWRRSLQVRVVVSNLALSSLVILILGFVLTSQVTDRILESKIRVATEEMERARVIVSDDVGGEETRSVQSSLELARNQLLNGSKGSDGGGAGAFDAVLLVPGDGPREATSAGPATQIPGPLREFVKAGQVSYQYSTVHTESFSGKALVIGSPTTSSKVTALELYLVFPLSNEESTISLVRGTIVTGGVVLLVLLAAVALLVARQVVLPVRSASRIAERFAEGHLSERMPVRGVDDMARLAVSFNDMAESLSREITQLEEFGNLQRRFTSDVSHELRTPLTTVRMAADLIYDNREELDPALQRSAELMVNELDRFETLLSDLLEISRHDAGVAELTVEQVDLRDTVKAVVASVKHLADELDTTVELDMPDKEIIAEVDPRRVERILRNLVANAIDHSEHKPVTIRMAADIDSVAVTVRDRGVGLRPGEEKLVFNRFWRADPSRKRHSGGTGLGLAISVEDARLHQGRLEAWGEPGNGALFRLTVPLVRGHKVTTSPLPLNPTSRPSSAVRRATSRGPHPGEQETTPMRTSGAKIERVRESSGGRGGDAS